jgi:hypothetical protein
MSRSTAKRTVRSLAGALLALSLAAGAGAEDGLEKGQTIARAQNVARGIVSLGGTPCSVTSSSRLLGPTGYAITLADLASAGSPALYEARRSGASGCVLELLQVVDELPD